MENNFKKVKIPKVDDDTVSTLDEFILKTGNKTQIAHNLARSKNHLYRIVAVLKNPDDPRRSADLLTFNEFVKTAQLEKACFDDPTIIKKARRKAHKSKSQQK